MSHKTAINILLWSIFFSKKDETRPKESASLKRPSNTLNTERTTFILGLINYLQPFLPDIAHKTTFLREQVSNWDWTPSTDVSYHQLKQWICNPLLKTTLAYYDHTKPVKIHTDASEYGLGAALMQNNRPIAFASKTLTDVETRYANIECECLSVVFGLEKFYMYIYGCQITVFNDHKPLEMIQKSQYTQPHLVFKECYLGYRSMSIILYTSQERK